jgi:hypothetical protein
MEKARSDTQLHVFVDPKRARTVYLECYCCNKTAAATAAARDRVVVVLSNLVIIISSTATAATSVINHCSNERAGSVVGPTLFRI